jgi:hypothetical protein
LIFHPREDALREWKFVALETFPNSTLSLRRSESMFSRGHTFRNRSFGKWKVSADALSLSKGKLQVCSTVRRAPSFPLNWNIEPAISGTSQPLRSALTSAGKFNSGQSSVCSTGIRGFDRISQLVFRLELGMQRMVIVHMILRLMCSQNVIRRHYWLVP